MIGERLEFAPWIKRFPGGSARPVVIFPHAGGAAVAYRGLANTLCANGVDVYIVQYPQRADRLAHPAAATIGELAGQLFAAGPWAQLGPLRLFGHCMGAVVAFEFARTAQAHGVEVGQLWASAGQAPSTIAGSGRAPSDDRELLADLADLGGTDPRLLADEDFLDLLLPAVRADYGAFHRYSCGPEVRIGADIHAVGGRSDHRIDLDHLRRWESHTDAVFTLTLFDGGHFYIDEHLEAVAELVSTV